MFVEKNSEKGKPTNTNTVKLFGDWVFANINSIDHELSSIEINNNDPVDYSKIDSLDTTGAALIKKHFNPAPSVITTFPESTRNIMNLVSERFSEATKQAKSNRKLFGQIGKYSITGLHNLRELLAFIGETAMEALRTIFAPKTFRVKEFFVHLENTFLKAIPVVTLVMLLIGVVVAYLFAIQIEKYGANIFIVDSVGLALFRELSPIVVAIIVAGRSGSAITAQLGAMKINEEVDALKVLGISPMNILIFPRILALIIALPLLTFIGDVIGIIGSMAIADLRLGITYHTFLARLQDVLPEKHFYVGLIKTPVFAAFIAGISCKIGLQVEGSARNLGLSTTSTVVQSIVAVILLNAGFAVIFVELGL